MSSILVVDDEPGVRSSISGVLQDEGFDVDTASSGEECLEKANGAAFDVIVLDIWLPGLDGLTTLQRLRERRIDSQVVIISGHGNIESAVRAIKMGAFDFIEKPLSLEKTVLVVRNALRQRDLEAENRVLRAKVDRQQERTMRRGQLRRDPGGVDRVRIVRARAWRVYGRRRRQTRPLRGSQRRHDL